MATERTHAYAGRWPCGHVHAVTVDMPDHAKDVAKDIASWIRDGATIERVTIEEARGLIEMDCRRAHKAPDENQQRLEV